MEIAGIDQRLIGCQSTRRQQIADALPVLTTKYEERQGHPPGERAAYALACQAADQTRRPERTDLRSLSELRAPWRDSAARAYGADVVARLAERARAAAQSDMGAGAPGRRRRPGRRRDHRRGVRDARRVRAPPPPRRSPPPPLLRPARPTPPARPGRTDRPDGHRRLHPPSRPRPDDDRRPPRPVPPRHR
ncbi:relaxase domain-containing protein [Streptomyces virginiae]|uniref:relaxase domain-containing protein n=1 Tax=Streptomyces virginiae TaxID=1961 RepID=UPI00365B2098